MEHFARFSFRTVIFHATRLRYFASVTRICLFVTCFVVVYHYHQTWDPQTGYYLDHKFHFNLSTCLMKTKEQSYQSKVPNSWLIVDDAEFLGYSAYFDKNNSMIKILGLRNWRNDKEMICALLSTETADNSVHLLSVTRATSVYINELDYCLWRRMCMLRVFDAYMIRCHLPSPFNITQQTFVSLLPASNMDVVSCQNVVEIPKLWVNKMKLSNIQLSNSSHQESPSDRLFICVSPVYDWNNPTLLKLFLEHYLSQGFNNFVLFKRSWSIETENVLRAYAQIVEVVDWPLFPYVSFADLNNETVVGYRGQLLANNDCLWRVKGKATFMATVDLDEFMTPVNRNFTLKDILLAKSKNRPNSGGFLVKNQFVTFDLNNVSSNTQIQFDDRTFDYSSRTKIIVKPDKVEKLGVHSVWRYTNAQVQQEEMNDVVMLHWKPKTMLNINSKQTFTEIFPKLLNRISKMSI